MAFRKSCFAWVMAWVLWAPAAVAGQLVNTEDHPYWRQLAQDRPFYAAMRADAITLAAEGTLSRDVLGGSALAYILDPDNRAAYLANVTSVLDNRITDMTIGPTALDSSVASHELFHALLALDVVQDDLDAPTRSRFRAMLRDKIMRLYIGKWDPHAWAMRMLWHQFAGERDAFAQARREWAVGLAEHYMEADGVSPAGAGYCVERWNAPERVAKSTPINVLEYLGHHDYFSDPGIVGLKEFMYGYAVSPFGRILLFGDSRNVETQRPWYQAQDGALLTAHVLSAARFSPEAHRSAMWLLREGAGLSSVKLRGHLINYLVMAGSAADNAPLAFDLDHAELAPSRLFKNFAALKSRPSSTESLYLAMQNLTGNTEYHTQFEVNALALAGYGEILLRNSGYDGPDRDVTVDGVTATFDFMHDDSESGNTLTIGGARHTCKIGGGITEGLVGGAIEYARGISDEAIAGVHARDVVMVQPLGRAHGYCLVMDHVTTDRPEDTVDVAWHPNAPALQVVREDTHYVSQVRAAEDGSGPRVFSENQAGLTTFLATPPASVAVKKTVNQYRGHPFVGDYLYATYRPKDQRQDVLTVLFPTDRRRGAGDLSRVAAGAYTGAAIVQGAVRDLALVSDGQRPGRCEGAAFQGEDVLLRREGGRLVSFFVRGTSFDDGGEDRLGFGSDQPVGICLDANGRGQVVAQKPAEVMFYAPGIWSVELNGEGARAAKPVASGAGWVRVRVPVGTFGVQLLF